MAWESRDARGAEHESLDRDVRALLRMNRDCERDTAEARDRLSLLQGLVSAFAAMASAFDTDDIVRCLLRAIRTPIGFDRAMWLDVERTKVVVAKWTLDESDDLERGDDVIEYEPAGQLSAVIGSRRPTSGEGHELGAPVVDVRNWYLLVPVSIQDEVRGIVFADGHRVVRSQAWYVELVASLAAVASIAIEKSTLLQHMEALASRDSLTGLFNRRAFQERIVERIGAGRSPFVFVVIDVDDFKSVNDARGHAAGDTVLKRLARTLLASSRADDIVGRFAGDEFVMLIDSVTGQEVGAMLERLSTALRAAGISCSIGASRYPAEAIDVESLFAVADAALYLAKARGKNGFAVSSDRADA